MMTFSQAFANSPLLIICNILIIVGALNWLAIGVWNKDLVKENLKQNAKIVYTIVGAAGVYSLFRMVLWISGKGNLMKSTSLPSYS
jgi:uncharacterized membrane protein YuzA (DUF378 family)